MVAHPSAPPYAGGFLTLCQRENGAGLKFFSKKAGISPCFPKIIVNLPHPKMCRRMRRSSDTNIILRNNETQLYDGKDRQP
jgi:hypothetical protein